MESYVKRFVYVALSAAVVVIFMWILEVGSPLVDGLVVLAALGVAWLQRLQRRQMRQNYYNLLSDDVLDSES